MTSGEVHEVSRIIGGLQTAVENLTTQWAEQDRQATEGRRIMHDKIDNLNISVISAQGDITALKREMAEIKPTVRAGEAAQLEGAGMRKLLRMLWQVIYALLCASGGIIFDRLHGGGK